MKELNDMTPAEIREHRKALANYLDKIHTEMVNMLSYWLEEVRDGGFLAEDEYPFTLSLDELEAEVSHSVELIRSRMPEDVDPYVEFASEVAALPKDGDVQHDETVYHRTEESAWRDLTTLIGRARALVHKRQRYEGAVIDLPEGDEKT